MMIAVCCALTFVEVMILSTGGLSDMPVDIRALAVSFACIFPHGVSTFPSAVGAQWKSDQKQDA